MAEKKQFVQIVDKKSGKIERVADLKAIESLPEEEKLELTKGKMLYIVTHVIEPILKVEMVKQKIEEEISYKQ
ncbi:MAG: hypothetical protein PHR06_13015 [Candidatus Cloacimonetes bacterium]|nr:hypothetical protein [Candidatus Cloacimonadota bacterium]